MGRKKRKKKKCKSISWSKSIKKERGLNENEMKTLCSKIALNNNRISFVSIN